MSELDKKIDETIDLLESYRNKLKSNIQSLYDEINTIEDSTLEKSKASFDSIKNDINSLETLIKEAEIKTETEDQRFAHDVADLKVDYFTSLTSIKNDLMNFMVENLDSLELSLDNYHNTTLGTIDSLILKTNQLEKSSIENFDGISLVLGKSLNEYSRVVIDYYDKLSANFDNIKSKISELLNIYNSSYEDYRARLNKDNQAYLELLSKSNQNNVTPSLILKDNDALFNSLEDIEKTIRDEYQKHQDALYHEFNDKSKKAIKTYERILSQTLGLDVDFFKKKEKTINEIKREILVSPNNKDLFDKLEKVLNDEELEGCITEIFKNYHKDLYEKYIALEENNEKEYSALLLKHNNQKLFKRLLLKDEKLKGSAIIENILFFKDGINNLDLLFKESIESRLNHSLEFVLKEVYLFDTLRRMFITYKYKSSLLLNELNFNLKVIREKIEREILTTIKDQSKEYVLYEIFRNKLYASDLKFQAVLDYEIRLNKIHRSYVIQKSILFLTNTLSLKSRDIDLLPQKFKYDKIISSYNVNKMSLDVIRNSQISLLDQTKTREELYSLSSTEFLHAFLRHKIDSACELIDLAKKELELRIEVLTKEKDLSNDYSEYEINILIGKFLDEIKELQEIKDIKLNAVLLKLDSVKEKSASFTFKMTDETNEILTDYNDSVNDIMVLIKKDSEINYLKDDISNRRDIYVNGLDLANKIHNHSLLEATKSIKIAESQIERLSNVMNRNESFNYAEFYHQYESDYNKNLDRIDNVLDSEISPIIEEIRRISSKYNEDNYRILYRELALKHQREVNALHHELDTKIQSIDNENKLQFRKRDEVFSNTIDSIEAINKHSLEVVEEYKKELDNRNILAKQEYDSSMDKSKDYIDSNTLAIISDFDEFNTILSEKLDLMNELSDLSYKNISKAQKDSKAIYKFERGAFIEDYKDRYKKLMKDIDDKYKNPSVYVLNGKKAK